MSKKLKSSTVNQRRKVLDLKAQNEREKYASVMNEISKEKELLQERCPHERLHSKWIDLWDGWDSHEDLKGHYEIICIDCGKKLKELSPTAYRSLNPPLYWKENFRETYLND